jgi:hypothetical protein
VEKAIRAHGGEARIARTKIGRLQAKADGTLFGVTPFRVNWEETFDLPRRYRQSIEGTRGGDRVQWAFAITGREGWVHQAPAAPKTIPVVPRLAVEGHWQTILPHLLLLRDKDVRLTLLGEKVQDLRTLAGIRAASDRWVADFYFDKSTGLLAQARRAMPNFTLGDEVIGDNSYADYREINGVQYPMRFKSNNGQNLSINLRITSLEFLEKIDDRVFAKPEVAEPPPAATSVEHARDTIRANEKPARWDILLAVAILCMGALSATLWLLSRIRKRKDEQMPQM